MLVKLRSLHVPYHIVLVAATVAFKECGYTKELLGKADMEWKEKVSDGPLDLDLNSTYELFVDQWNEKLKLIYLHSNIPKGKANSAEELVQS